MKPSELSKKLEFLQKTNQDARHGTGNYAEESFDLF